MRLELLLHQTLNGLSFGALLFLLASGFTLAFGLMRIANLAHGGFYLLGGYIGVVVTLATQNFVLGLITGAVAVGIFALGVERLLLRRVRGKELPEVLLTVGVTFVIGDLCLAYFGGDPHMLKVPDSLSGSTSFGFTSYPRYRLFLILFTLAIAVLLFLLQRRTRIGAMIRAGVDDREIARAMGINVDRVFTWVFVFGGLLAGAAGVVGSGLLSVRPGVDIDILLFALVVVIIGGLGSIEGAAVGAIMIGLIDEFSKAWIPELSYFTVFAPMAIVLMLRPTGLFGRRA